MKIFWDYFLIFFASLIILSGCGSRKNDKTDSAVVSKDTSVSQIKKDSVISNNNVINNTSTITNNSTSTITTTLKDDFNIIYATSQQWHGGVKGSGGGTNYEICIVSLFSSSQLIIDDLWIGENFHEPTVSRKFPKISQDGFSKGDTIYIYANDYIKDADIRMDTSIRKEQTNEKKDGRFNKFLPCEYSGEALIGYKINGRRKYKEVATITVKKPLFYP